MWPAEEGLMGAQVTTYLVVAFVLPSLTFDLAKILAKPGVGLLSPLTWSLDPLSADRPRKATCSTFAAQAP